MITYALKNGKQLNYNPDKHIYIVDNKIVPSVTGICGRGIPKPQLIDWLVSTPLYEFKRLIKEKLENSIPIDNVELERMQKIASSKTNNVRDDAGLIGTVVHGLIESYLKDQPIVKQTHRSFFQRGWLAHEPVTIGAFRLYLEKSG